MLVKFIVTPESSFFVVFFAGLVSESLSSSSLDSSDVEGADTEGTGRAAESMEAVEGGGGGAATGPVGIAVAAALGKGRVEIEGIAKPAEAEGTDVLPLPVLEPPAPQQGGELMTITGLRTMVGVRMHLPIPCGSHR